VIGFDVLNEPNWGSVAVEDFEQARLAPLYERVVRAVRVAAPAWVAFLEPSAARNIGFETKLSPFDFPDVMYAPHSYDASAERGNGFDPSQRGSIIDTVGALAKEAGSLNAGLWIGEYGGRASDPGIAEYMTAEYDAAGQVAAGAMYWAYDKSDGYGLLAPDGSEKETLVVALVRPYPERVAGDPIAYAFDPASSAFTFTYAPDPLIKGATEIVVPARVYRGGYEVDCGGCRYEEAGDVLKISTPPTSRPAEIRLRPR
jgi:endoglycosylceramidase